MSIDLLPEFVRTHYEVYEWKHACAILNSDFPQEWADVIDVLTNFRILKRYITKSGGNKSPVSAAIDQAFYDKNWQEKSFDTKVTIDATELDSPTHKVDCYRNRVALEIEWNNKDPFFDRDLNNFRLLFDLRAISVGIILTRSDHIDAMLNRIAEDAGRKPPYGQSSTHMGKLLPRIEGGSGGGCPLLVFGLTLELYVDDEVYVNGDRMEPEVVPTPQQGLLTELGDDNG